MKTIRKISFSWKKQISFLELSKNLKDFGIHVYEDPAYEGNDSFGLIFTNEPMTKEELKIDET